MAYQFLLCDLATDTTLLDLTGYATGKLSPRLSRPMAVTLNLPADTPGLYTAAADGDTRIHKGTRTVKVKKGSTLVAHTRIHNIGWDGDENTATIQTTSYDPLMQLGARNCWDSTNHIADFHYPSPTTGASMLQDVITNSVTNEDEVITTFSGVHTPALFPLDYTTGTISSTVDLSSEFTDTPMTIADLVTLLSSTGVLDVMVTPTDTSLGATAGKIGVLQVVDRWGSDLTATVHFDYGTGSYNVAKARRTDSIDTLSNRLIYELGPKRGYDVWQGNISGTEAALSTPWQEAQLASRTKYGTWAQFRVYDDGAAEAYSRPLFHALWKAESTFRVDGRELLMVTPAAGDGALFTPFTDYNVGDTVAVNTTQALMGETIVAEPYRIYGFDVDVSSEGTEIVSEFIASPDGL